MQRMRTGLRAKLCVLAIGAAFTLAACGEGSSDDAAAASGTDSEGLARAQALVDEHSDLPTEIGITEPVGVEIPTGKEIVYINCGAEACTNTGNALSAAGDVLGWNTTMINIAPTPQEIQKGFDEAIRLKPDAVAYNGLPTAAFQRQLAELESMNIPVVAAFVADPIGGGLEFTYVDAETVGKGTEILAAKTLVDAGGPIDVGLVNITDYPIVPIYTKAYGDRIKADCSSCNTKTLDVQVAEIGKDAPAKIVNFLRANPDIKALYLALDDFAIGLPAALRNAGLEDIKIYSWAPTKAGIQGLQDGERTASVPTQQAEGGWYLADALARIFTEQPIVKAEVDDIPWTIWAKDTEAGVPESVDNPPFVVDYEKQFAALWGK